jgi:HTH-type transcriptional regulator / antitoxin HigA
MGEPARAIDRTSPSREDCIGRECELLARQPCLQKRMRTRKPQTQTINPSVRPRVIKSKAEHERALAEIESLMSKPRLTPEEREAFELLMTLTGEYESRTFPRKRAAPTELIQFLLEQNGQPQKALAGIFHETHVSEVLSRKRKISVPQAVKLGKHFNVDPAVFIEELRAAASR